MGDLFHTKTPVTAAEDRKVGHDDIDAGGASKRVTAGAHQLGAVAAVAVLHQDHHRSTTDDQVHGSADTSADNLGRAPVRHIASGVHLVGAENDHVDLARADHLKRGD